jgi:hypothetical protein
VSDLELFPLDPGQERRDYRRSEIEAADCLYFYDKQYNQGVTMPSDQSIRGTTFHRAAELYIAKLVALRVTADFDLAREAFVDAVEQSLCPAYLMPEAERLFFRFAERFELKTDAVLHVETQLVTVRGRRRFTWKPDLVYAEDAGIVIYDWKTHYHGLTAAQARETFQARFYLSMAAEHWPNQPRYVFRFVYVRFGLVVEVVFTPDDLVEIDRQITGMVAVLDEADRIGEYPARSGPHCAFCRLDCPINGRDGLMPIRVDTFADFEALAAEYLALKRRLFLMGKALRTFTTAEGPQEVNGMVFHNWPTTAARLRVDRTLAILEDAGVADPGLTVSRSELGPLTDPRKFPTVAPALEAIAIKRTSFTFAARKAGAIIPDGVIDLDHPETLDD